MIQCKQKIIRDFFVVEGSLAEMVQNHSICWICIQYIFISGGAVFLMCSEYLKQDSNDNLYFNNQFLEKGGRCISLNKINLVFSLKFGYITLYLKIYITDLIVLFHISKLLAILN